MVRKTVPYEFSEPVKRTFRTTPTTMNVTPSNTTHEDISADNSSDKASISSDTEQPFISLGQELRDRSTYDCGNSLRSSTGSQSEESCQHPSHNYTKIEIYDKLVQAKNSHIQSEDTVVLLNNKLKKESSYLDVANRKFLSLEQKVIKSETLHSGSKERLKHLSDTIKLMKQSSVESKTLHDATVDLKSQIFRVTAESKLTEMRVEN